MSDKACWAQKSVGLSLLESEKRVRLSLFDVGEKCLNKLVGFRKTLLDYSCYSQNVLD